MERIENCGSVSARLTRPSEDPSAFHVLDPNVPETRYLTGHLGQGRTQSAAAFPDNFLTD
jgi:hypothetical protein